jgi:hypothetical protein
MPLHDHAFRYVECDVPAGVTLERWRIAKAPARRRRPLDGLLRLVRATERAGRGRQDALVAVVPADAIAS